MPQHLEKPRIKALDSFRGLAALAVVFFHVSNGIAGNNFVNTSPLYLLISSNEAVLFFFVLSGYVLVYQYGIATKFNYKTFIVQRFFRLYIPYFFAVLIAYLLLTHSVVTPRTDVWLSKIWQVPLTGKLLFNHFILLTNFNTLALDPAIWSLVHEMRIVIIFPLLLYAVLQFPSRKVILFAALFSFVAAIAGLFAEQPVGYHTKYTDTLYYSYMFVIGGLIARHQSLLVAKYTALPPKVKLVYFAIALTLYCYAHTLEWIETGGVVGDRILSNIADLIVVASSGYFIIYGIYISDKQSIFNSEVTRYLGKISYSLYLIHVPVCEFIYYKFFALSKHSLKPAMFLFIVVSIIAGIIFNYLIERPSQKIAKRIALGKN